MRTVLLFSGGLDSAVLLYSLHSAGVEVLPLAVDYGQRHRRELRSARDLAPGLRTLAPGSALTDPSAPLPAGPAGGPAQAVTVVPGRNLQLISLAVAHAVSGHADAVAYAATASDAEVYPDCRPSFLAPLREAVAAVRPSRLLRLEAPFLGVGKAEVVALGASPGVPFGLTWSCYAGGGSPCRSCGACVGRAAAFARAGLADPGAA